MKLVSFYFYCRRIKKRLYTNFIPKLGIKIFISHTTDTDTFSVNMTAVRTNKFHFCFTLP